MTTLAIDPGITTGVALFDDEDTLLFTFESTQPHERLIEEITTRGARTTIVLERPPSGKRHQSEATDDVIAIVERCADGDQEVVFVLPSAWKSHPAGFRGRQLPSEPASAHERDASGMGNYYNEVVR